MISLSRLDLYRLMCADGIGNRKLNRILQSGSHSGPKFEEIQKLDIEDFLADFPGLTERDYRAIKEIDVEKATGEFESLINIGVEIIPAYSAEYPATLSKYLGVDAPPLLFAYGNIELLQNPGVAIIGARRASDEGLNIVEKTIDYFTESDFVIISGGAQGIDSIAHRSAVEKNLTTIIVLAFGINSFLGSGLSEFPENRALALSQFLPNSPWIPAFAMIRNGLVCALSKAVIVIESDTDGGTVNAGRTALKMGIPLYVFRPEEFKTPPPGNQQLISLGGRVVSLDSMPFTFVDEEMA